MIKKNGMWVVRIGFGNNTSEVCVLIQERFNKLIRTRKGNLPLLPTLLQRQEAHFEDDQPAKSDETGP